MLKYFSIRPELKCLSLKNPIHFLSLGFGSGLAPIAPGTFGSLAAIPVYLLLMFAGMPIYIAATVLFAILGFWFCGYTAQALKTHDHPAIVWDEVVGMLITLFYFPLSYSTVIIGFLYFRVFDIIKPWPIKWLDQKVHGGIGIMLDDMLAGVFAWCALYLTHQYIYDLSSW